jgi:TRAP-type transport system periplasmic protein
VRLAPGTMLAAAITPAIALAGGGFAAAQTCSLIGASRFDEDHVFTKTMRKSEELMQQYYEGQGEVEFERHRNSEPGLEGARTSASSSRRCLGFSRS